MSYIIYAQFRQKSNLLLLFLKAVPVITTGTAIESKSFQLCITPEGTRSLNPEWKKGFYYIAYKAQIPILLYGVDYEKRLIKCTESFVPTGDFEKEMRQIKLYFKDFKGKHPELFTIGNI